MRVTAVRQQIHVVRQRIPDAGFDIGKSSVVLHRNGNLESRYVQL